MSEPRNNADESVGDDVAWGASILDAEQPLGLNEVAVMNTGHVDGGNTGSFSGAVAGTPAGNVAAFVPAVPTAALVPTAASTPGPLAYTMDHITNMVNYGKQSTRLTTLSNRVCIFPSLHPISLSETPKLLYSETYIPRDIIILETN
jgi:hypothetical protein